MTTEEFGQKIKQKYPQYNELSDLEVGQKMLIKYPQYQNTIQDDITGNKVDTFLSGHSVLKGISDYIGTTGLGKGLAQGLFLKFTPEGKDLLNRLSTGEITTAEVENIIGKPANAKEIYGSALRTFGSIAAFGKPAPTALGRIGVGTGIGTIIGTGQALEQGGNVKQVAKGGAIGAGVGFAVSGLVEAAGALIRGISQSKGVKKATGGIYTKELQPPKKDVINEIKYGFKSFGEQVADVVDDKGKPVYVGTYNTLLKNAKTEIATKTPQLEELISSAPKTTITRNEVSKNILQTMENKYGKLTSAQIKQINFEVSRMPEVMDLTELLNAKRMYDKLIPTNFWSKINDPAISFPSLVKYILRDNARQVINMKTNNPLIQQLNNEISVAIDVRDLVSTQIAQRELWKISGQGGVFYKLIGKFVDDILLNPAVTTRAAQTIRRAGIGVGEGLVSQLTKLGATKSLINQVQSLIDQQTNNPAQNQE